MSEEYRRRLEVREAEYVAACDAVSFADILLRDARKALSDLQRERIAELEAQVKQLREALEMNLPSDEADTAPEFLALLEATKPDGE